MEYEQLTAQVRARIREKDAKDQLIDSLQQELEQTMNSANAYWSKFDVQSQATKDLANRCQEQEGEIGFVKHSLKAQKRLTLLLKEQNASMREDLEIIGEHRSPDGVVKKARTLVEIEEDIRELNNNVDGQSIFGSDNEQSEKAGRTTPHP